MEKLEYDCLIALVENGWSVTYKPKDFMFRFKHWDIVIEKTNPKSKKTREIYFRLSIHLIKWCANKELIFKEASWRTNLGRGDKLERYVENKV
jgi:hypothetical protein